MNWLLENKEWLFSGIGVFIIAFTIKLITSKQKKTTIKQLHKGIGDNVAGDKNVKLKS